MIKFLALLEGKKTVIGVALLFMAEGTEKFFIGSGWTCPDVLNGCIAVFNYFGYAMAGIGALDKFRRGELTTGKGATTE